MTQNTQSFSPGKSVFVGIDVHLQSYSVVALEGESRPIKATIPAEPEALVRFLRGRFQSARIYSVYEAGFSGFVLHRLLIEQGISNIVVNPSAVPVSSWDRVKTDKRDAMKLATLLRAQALKAITIPSAEQELERMLTRTRSQIVKERSRVAIQIKSKLRQLGYLPHNETKAVSSGFVKELLEWDLPLELKESLFSLIEIWKTLNAQRKRLEKLIADKISTTPNSAIYQSIPGVGATSCAILLYELGDPGRFSNERNLYSFTGLTPAEYSSGEHIRKGHISRQGNARLRGVLVEVAWRAIRKDESLRLVYEKLKHRRGAKRAIVAVARRLAGRIRACALKQEKYRIAA